MALDVTVRSITSNLKLTGLSPETDIATLKTLVHQQGQREHLSIPPSAKQRLVFKGTVLSSGTLKDAGVASGDQLVLLFSSAPLPQLPEDTTPVPNAATIRAAVIAEARRRGLEDTIREPPARRAGRPFGHDHDALPLDVDTQLIQLLQVLEGRVAQLGIPGAPGPQGQAGGAQGQAAGGAPGGAGAPPPPRAHINLSQTLAALATSLEAAAGQVPAGMHAPPPPPEPPAAIPEPSATGLAQLMEMGFGEAVTRKALLLHRNETEAALNWLLQHGEDPAAAEPLTQEQLRQIYSRAPRGPPSEPELVEQLVEMGFSREQSAAALRRFRNVDLALAYLLRAAEQGAGDEGGGAQQGAGQGLQQAAGAAPPGAAAAAQGQGAAGGGGGGPGVQAPVVDGEQVTEGEDEEAAEGGSAGEGEEGDEEADDGEHEDEMYTEDVEDEDEDYEDDDPGEGEAYDDDEEHDPAAGAAPGELPAAFALQFPAVQAPLAPPAPAGLFSVPAAMAAAGGQAPLAARGPDGNDIVLSSGGADLPPLMPMQDISMMLMGGRGGAPVGMGMGGLADLGDMGEDDEAELREAMAAASSLQQLLTLIYPLEQAMNAAGAGGGAGHGGGAGGANAGARQ